MWGEFCQSLTGRADYKISLEKYLVVGKLVPVSEAPKEGS